MSQFKQQTTLYLTACILLTVSSFARANLAASKTEAQIRSPLVNLESDLQASASATPIYEEQLPQNLQQQYAQPLAGQSSMIVDPTTIATGDLNTAAGHHSKHSYGKYYEYREVPKKKTWKFGYKRGNHKHTISRHEHGKAGKHPHFKTKVKWHDKKSKGKGIHIWDYNHHDKKHHYG